MGKCCDRRRNKEEGKREKTEANEGGSEGDEEGAKRLRKGVRGRASRAVKVTVPASWCSSGRGADELIGRAGGEAR